jgi:thymidylate synthase (FAD)
MSKIQVLDHGYVEHVLSWGSDENIVESARMSTGKGFQGWGPTLCSECGGIGIKPVPDIHGQSPIDCKKCEGTGKIPGDEKLLKFLWDHHHTSPFEMAGMIVEVRAPIFVFREWHRHRTQSYNEMSGRYTVLPDLYYIPSITRLMEAKQSNQNKQSSEGGITEELARHAQIGIRDAYERARIQYQIMLDAGFSREVARVVLPVGQYSTMRAQGNLWNWLHFLSLRMDKAAQWEIRQYANVVGQIIRDSFPRTWELFEKSRS